MSPLKRELVVWVVLVAFAFITRQRVQVWHDNVSLWRSAVATTPCLARPRLQLALADGVAGQAEDLARQWQALTAIVQRTGSCR